MEVDEKRLERVCVWMCGLNKDAKDVMVHRKNVVALDDKMTLSDTIEFINNNSFSRYPVYLDDIDDIIGSVHIKQLLSM